MNTFKKLNNRVGWGVFTIAAFVYLSTIEPTASWWDPGEYIATSYKLQVGHPPGAPLFQMMGRIFSLFSFGNVAHVAMTINIMSALASAFTILFLFWTITLFAKRIYLKKPGDELTKGQTWAILGAGAVGALAYTFSDSFWFSAVEAEVYATSSFFTAITFWAILRWEQVANERSGFRWIILIAYLSGLAIGVHLLNLLTIPAIAYVYYFKKYKFSWKGFIGAGVAGIGILAIVMYIIIPQVVNFAGKFELFCVNGLGLPFDVGTVIYFLALIGLLAYGIYYTQKNGKVVYNTILLALTFVLIGYSSFLMLVIRSNADTPINENDPKNAVNLLAYLNRQQYGTWPLLYGQYYNAPMVGSKNGTPVYKRDNKTGRYVVIDNRKQTIPVYDPRFETIFPRMWSNQKPSHIRIYKSQAYGGKRGTPIRVDIGNGKTKVLIRPSFATNLKFFFTYQINHMYIRYFMWNFVGRQNNIEGQGEIDHGNWISGINFIDRARLGDQANLPASMKNPARARLYFLPLILGLLGFFFQLSKSKKDTWVVWMLFFMTGIAIIIYLNQTPMQPRERDYAYVGSFYAFAIWIGFGVLSLYESVKKYFGKKEIAAALVIVLSLVLVPANMAKEEWSSHDRAGKYSARDFAVMYLKSCPPNAILITNGDNDTFPLWYAQEVEGIRTDVRVVNYMLAGASWYVDQMFKQEYNSAPLPLSISSEKYDLGAMNFIPAYPVIKGAISLKDAIAFIGSDNPKTKIALRDGDKIDYLPSKELFLKVDSAAAVNSGTVAKKDAGKIVKEIRWKVTQSPYLYRNDVMLLDLIANNNWKRPICFANPSSVSRVLNVAKYSHMRGLVYQFTPVPAMDYAKGIGGVAPDSSYRILMNKDVRWGRLNMPDVHVDRESFRNSILAKQSYVRLAQALVNLHKYDSAVNVLDRGIYFFPNSKFPFDYYTIHWALLYYQSGAFKKGNKVATEIYNRYMGDLSYYNNLNDRFIPYYNNNIREALSAIQQLSGFAKDFHQDTLAKKFKKGFYDQLKLMEGTIK
ncbi:putative membrane protein [hydrothermal vent metagenome]|uniref:Putative membrane protein n=1 Tax=hydrothermal vent metagenome TaxID=652676 RepID=A0A3B0UIJ9_9ZZZZ